MNFRINSKIDETDYMKIEVEIDTIETDDPTMNLLEESLDVVGHLLCPHSQEFVDAWENDDEFLDCIKSMAETGTQKVEREKYTIEIR